MTIKKKIYTAGALIFLIFVVFAFVNIRMHQKVVDNLKLRDQLRLRLEGYESFMRWKNSLIRLVSDSFASGHVPHFSDELLAPPVENDTPKTRAMLDHAVTLVSLLNKKEEKIKTIEQQFQQAKSAVHDLYIELDEKIATVLALIQMDEVMGKEVQEKSSLAPFVLKSLNQLTLIALDSIISKSFSEMDKGVVARNRQFLSDQLHIVDESGSIAEMFARLFDQIDFLIRFIPESRQSVETIENRIASAKTLFDNALAASQISRTIADIEKEVALANEVLETASRHTLMAAFLFLLIVPVAVVLMAVFGLNALVVDPINRLVEVMKKFQAGDFCIQAKVKNRDEIGILAAAFNTMAGEIKEKVDAMARLNKILKESESKYRTLVENIPQAIFLKNRNRAYVSCNKRFAADLGLPEREIIGRKDEDLCSGKWADKYKQEDERILNRQKPEEIEESFQKKGSRKYILKIITPVMNDEGEVSGILGIYSDITERKQAEVEKDRLIAAINHTSDIIIITDIKGVIQYANPSFETATGYAVHEIIGKDPLVLRNNRHNKEICTDIWQTISSGDTWQGRLSYQRKDDSEFIVEASISPILNSEGEIVSFVEVNRDITNEIKMEKQLRQAQKMEAIGNLAGGIAHDFNNLLFPIIGISELLMDNFSENSFEHDNLKEIFKAGRRGEALVKQILTFSRKTEDSLMPVNFQQVIKEVCKLIRSTIPADIEIVEHLELELGMVMANPSQLHQIAMNLVTNAYHGVEPVKGKISLQLNRIELKKNDMMDTPLEPGSYAEFSVSDTGTGIAPDIITQIFDPYFTTKERGKGTGLGLATVYGIVKEYNGDIKVYSEPGKGTTFTVYLPLTRCEDDFAVQKKTKDLPPGNEHILLVDDEESIVQIEKQFLERLGYSATAFTSSQAALKAFETRPDDFDLVVSDMTMPEMNGDQLAEKLMQIKPGQPFIMCTGFSERINKTKAEQMGIKAFLMKPVAMHDFARTVRSVLDRAEI